MSAAFAESSTRDSKSRCCIRCAARATCSPPKPLRSSAVPTTLRIALLAGLLALLSNLAVIGFIYWRTHDEAVSTVRSQVVEQAKVISDVYRTGGKTALDDAVEDTMTYGDPQTAVGLFDSKGREIMGNLAAVPSGSDPWREGDRNGLIRLRGQTTPGEGVIVTQRL